MKTKPGEKDEVLEEFVPFSIRSQRCKRQLCIILKPEKGGNPIWDYDKELVLPIALGHAWTARLARGEFGSTNALAADLCMDPSQIMRYMRLTRLAPDIIEAILCGEQPPALRQEDLFRHMPYAWVEQRKVLGFTAQRATEAAQAELDAPPSPLANGVRPAPVVSPRSAELPATRDTTPSTTRAAPPSTRDASPPAARQPAVRKPAPARPKRIKPPGEVRVIANETHTASTPVAAKPGIPHQTSLFGPE